MKIAKKIFIFLLVVCFLVGIYILIFSKKDTKLSTINTKITNSFTAERGNEISHWSISATDADNVTATLYEGGTFVINGSGKMTNYKDTEVGWVHYEVRPYYSYIDQIKNVIIEGNVTNIGQGAFYECKNLNTLTINCNLETINFSAFFACTNLAQIQFNASVNTINALAFDDCDALTAIKFPEGLITICDSICSCDNLTEIYIPSTVKEINAGAFNGCPNINKIEVSPNNTTYDSRNNCNAIIERETNSLLVGCMTTKIPDGITNISERAFRSCSNLTTIDIPSTVTTIGKSAFERCSNLAAIDIPNGVTAIEYSTFLYCSNLTNVNIPDTVTTIGSSAFQGCSNLETIHIPNGITTIKNSTFSYCSDLTTVNIPNTVTVIESNAFEKCTSLRKIEILKNVTNIEKDAFKDCSKFLIFYVENNSVAQKYAKDNQFSTSLVDYSSPTINGVTGNSMVWTNQDITLTVDATDDGSGIATENAYSFDNGNSWQTSNTKTYTQNTNGIIVQVKDNKGNIATYDQIINIDKIDKVRPTIEIIPNGANVSNNQAVDIIITDAGGSGLSNNNSYQYQLVRSEKEVNPNSWQDYVSGRSFIIGGRMNGEYYLLIKTVSDNAGNKSEDTEYFISNKFTFSYGEYLGITSSNYDIDKDNDITNISPKTTINNLLENLTCNYEIKVYNKDNEEIKDKQIIVATGMKITANNKSYVLCVKGDVDGTGIVDLNDAIKILQHRAGGTNPKLIGVYLKAAQLTTKGQVTLNDVIKVMRYKATNGKKNF